MYYVKQIIDYVNFNPLSPVVVTDNSTCAAAIENDILRKCEGTAPYLKPVEDFAGALAVDGWTVGNNVAYKHFYNMWEPVNWWQARDKCFALGNGASLAAITSWAERYLVDSMDIRRTPWIGANDLNIEGRWTWVQGANNADEPITWSNWYSTNPDNLNDKNPWGGGADCAVIGTSHGGAWDDFSCGKSNDAYLCQIRF